MRLYMGPPLGAMLIEWSRLHCERMDPLPKPAAEIADVLDELDVLLKNSEIGAVLSERGVNVSLALLFVDGLRLYVHGEKRRAVEDLGDAIEEIRSRLQAD